jgi:hypothetical protein
VDTRFFVDHTEVDAIVEKDKGRGDPTAFPRLAEGHEYLTFSNLFSLV